MKNKYELMGILALLIVAVVAGVLLSGSLFTPGDDSRIQPPADNMPTSTLTPAHTGYITPAPLATVSFPIFQPTHAPVNTAVPTVVRTATPSPRPTERPICTVAPTPVPVAREVYIAHAQAFATHEAMSNGISFEASHLLDRDDETSWQYDITATGGREPYVEFVLATPSKLTQLKIRNGYWKISGRYDQYTRNGRVMDFAISFLYEGQSNFTDPCVYRLRDEKVEQSFPLQSNGIVRAVRITILTVYRGTKFVDDVAINEIKLLGYPAY